MDISILELLDGAKQARGATVIIDVFRAFSLEPIVLDQGVERLIAIGSEEIARAQKQQNPSFVLIGERQGRKPEGFDYGNSPSEVEGISFHGKTVLHTTSAGTQGLSAASKADIIFAASLVNARATASVIKQMHPSQVSLVCMGWEGRRKTEEDLLCAQYIRSLLLGEDCSDIKEKAYQLRYQEGKKFFDSAQADVFPEQDFWICTDVDRYAFAIQAVPISLGFSMRKVLP